MMPHRQAMVRGEENPGLVGLSGFFQGSHNAADLIIQVADEGKIFLPVHLHRMTGPGKRGELFIAQPASACHGFGPGISRHKVFRNGHHGGRITVDVGLRSLSGIMGGIESHIHKVGAIPRAGRFQKSNGLIGNDLTPVHAAFPVTTKFRIAGRPGIGKALQRTAVTCLGVLGHACPHRSDLLKDGLRIGIDMPFPREAGLIACCRHQLGPEPPLFFKIGVSRTGRLGLSVFLPATGSQSCGSFFSPPDRQSSVQHVPTGDTHRATPGTHVVGVGEHRPFRGKSVQMRGRDLTVPHEAKNLVGQIVRKEKKNVGTGRRWLRILGHDG